MRETKRDLKRAVRGRTMAVLATAALAALAVAASPLSAAEPEAYRKVLEQRSPSVVTVRFLLHAELGGDYGSAVGELPDLETEIAGLMIDPGGLVVCSNSHLGGMLDLIKAFMGGMASQLEMVATPREIEVLLDGGRETLKASLVARDSDLDLAWIQIDNPDGRTFPAVELTSGAALAVGDPVVLVRRLEKSFGRAAALLETRVGGVVSRPRPLLLTTVPITGFGLPAFDLEGRLVGITVIQLPDSPIDLTSNPLGMLTRAFELQQSFSGLLMPVSELARATVLAREMAAQGRAVEEADDAAEQGGDETGDQTGEAGGETVAEPEAEPAQEPPGVSAPARGS